MAGKRRRREEEEEEEEEETKRDERATTTTISEAREREDDDDDAARLVAQHYSGRANQSHAERKRSVIYRLRCLNNWVKSAALQRRVREGDRVMDLACGKGGDLKKYARARIASYVGVDIALESVRRDAVKRYNAEHAREFPATFVAGDAFVVDLAKVLPESARALDVIS